MSAVSNAGTASNLISLPGGGGALQGIGEQFAPEAFTGTGNLTVPLALPPGRGGFGPELSLAYSSGRGNGPFGLGWTVTVAEITRKTAKGVPRYDDRTDTFVLSSADDLVPVDATPSATRYRPRTEGLFARIIHHHLGADDYWEVRGKDGSLSVYGTPGAAGSDPAVVAKPDDRSKVFTWKLTSTQDPFGNRVGYAYQRDLVTGGIRRFDQLYLAQVGYVDVEDTFLVTVSFAYDERPDPFSTGRGGFDLRTRRRCTRIEIHTHAGQDAVTRTYDLRYVDQTDVPASMLPRNGVSLLHQVTVTGHDGTRTERLPTLEFDYTHFQPERRRFIPVQGELPAASLTSTDLDVVDLSGDGLPDLVELNGTARYWTNLGGGAFARPRAMRRAPAGLGLADPGVQLLDADGDGRIDLLTTGGALSGYFPLTAAGEWDAASFQRHPHAPTFDLIDPQLELVDLDGDGVTDAIRSGARFECFFADPDEGWRDVRVVPRGGLDVFPNVSFADPRVRLADMTGDGLADVVSLHDGAVEYWPSHGRGDWGPRVRMPDSPRLPHGYDPARLLLGDVDGDGCADLVYVDHRRVLVWSNRGGNGWSEPTEITGTPSPAGMAVLLLDLLGGGIAGLLWSGDARADGRHQAFFLDFTGGTKPYLLTEMNNHSGAVTTVTYEPSTRSRKRDTQAGLNWQATLPFPVQVVSRVRQLDQISGGTLTTEYRYHHGYWDGTEREFRGFGMVERFDTETIDTEHFSPPTVSKTWFHLGTVASDYRGEFWAGDPPMLHGLPELQHDAARTLRGKVLRTELYGIDGVDRPYTVTESTYGVRKVSEDVHFGHPTALRTTQWERGDDPMSRLSFVEDYDDYGQACKHTEIACPRGWRAGAASEQYLTTYTETVFATRDDDLYIVDRAASTTEYEIITIESATVAELRAAIADGTAARRVVDRTLNFYDGEPFTGLPAGELGAHGAPTRTERLVHDDATLHAAYGTDVPPYLSADGDPVWTEEYPLGFRDALPAASTDDPTRPGLVINPAGYGFAAEEPGRGFYVAAERRRFGARGQLLAVRDPLGRETAITYDRFELLPSTITDPAGLTTSAQHEYRLLQPREITDPNGNSRLVGYTPLGLPESITVTGKNDEGDTADAPSARFDYDFLAFERGHGPLSVRTVRRVHHVAEPGVPESERDETIETVEFTDGVGRLLQTRTQAEDVGAVVVSGWQTYDNKGRVVERYEPFFATGFAFALPGESELGHKATMVYDPRGQVVRAVAPDGSLRGVVYGVPGDLAEQESFAPTPWEVYTYDANDLATEAGQPDRAPVAHHFTPVSTVVDGLGRVIEKTERLGRLDGDRSTTRTTFDVRGNPRTVTDALGRAAFSFIHNLADTALRTETIDAGTTRVAIDAAGNEIERRDGKGGLTLRTYDVLGRPSRLWARDAAGRSTSLREHTVYGDELPHPQAVTDNLLGRPHRQFDEAGLLVLEAYDFKGNVLDKARQVMTDAAIMSGASIEAGQLDNTAYRTTYTYDALDRITTMRYPRDVEGARKKSRRRYNRAGALERVELDGNVVVERIAYNAKGQRTQLSLGNGVITHYDYDARTFRLSRLRSKQEGSVLQDFAYTYDLAGNLTDIRDRTPGCGIPGTPLGADALDRQFGYDARYRLISATGRECDLPGGPPWDGRPRCVDLTRTRAYTESYDYDDVGTLTRLRHSGGESGFTREFLPGPGTNLLAKVTAGQTVHDYSYDAAGNLVQENSSRHFAWDHANQLRRFRTQPDGGPASLSAHYRYDADGRRVVKLVEKGGRIEVTVYLDDLFEQFRITEGGATAHQSDTVHVTADDSRVAMIRVGAPPPGDATPPVRYDLIDHLGSSNVVVDGDGAQVNREEYTPYGATSFGSFARKRYRFTGKERDSESGLAYHGARYYAPWLARWVSPDPAGPVDGVNLHAYAVGDPLRFVDPSGTQAAPADTDEADTITATPATPDRTHAKPGAVYRIDDATTKKIKKLYQGMTCGCMKAVLTGVITGIYGSKYAAALEAESKPDNIKRWDITDVYGLHRAKGLADRPFEFRPVFSGHKRSAHPGETVTFHRWKPGIESTLNDFVKDFEDGWYYFGGSVSGAYHSISIAVHKKADGKTKTFFLDQTNGFREVTGQLDEEIADYEPPYHWDDTLVWPLRRPDQPRKSSTPSRSRRSRRSR